MNVQKTLVVVIILVLTHWVAIAVCVLMDSILTWTITLVMVC